jgi:hypothetical protein
MRITRVLSVSAAQSLNNGEGTVQLTRRRGAHSQFRVAVNSRRSSTEHAFHRAGGDESDTKGEPYHLLLDRVANTPSHCSHDPDPAT